VNSVVRRMPANIADGIHRIGCLAAVTLGSIAQPIGLCLAQSTPQGNVARSDRIQCAPRCEIVMKSVVALSGDDAEHTFLDDSQPVRDSRSFFYVYPVNSRSEIHVFNSRGQFVRVIGRAGRGPGEFESVYRIVIGPNDSVFVESVDRRLQVFDSTGKYVRGFGLPFLAHGLIHLGGGKIVAQASLLTADAIGSPLHLLDAQGRVLRSFGSSGEVTTVDDFTSTLRAISATPNGAVLSAWPNRYRIERWDAEGTLRNAINRAVDWFPRWDDAGLTDVDVEKPKPYLGSTMEADGVIWTAIRVPDLDWRQGRATQRSEYDRPLTPVERERYIDEVVEALDATTGRLLASTRVRSGLIGFLGDGFVFHRVHRPDGTVSIEILRIGLSSR
jgi:6-bladed beta-propeller protein